MKTRGVRHLVDVTKNALNVTKKTSANLFSNLWAKGEEDKLELQLVSLTDRYRKISEQVNRGRKQEVQYIFDIFQKRRQHNIVLVGNFGVGKNSTVEAIAESIAKNNCPEDFKNRRVIEMNVNDLNPSMYSHEKIMAKIAAIYNYMEQNPKDILYMRNFNLILQYELLECLKSMFKQYLFITTIDVEKYDGNFFDEDEFINTYFEIIDIEPPEYEEVYDMLKFRIHELSKYHNVRIKKSGVELIMDMEFRKNQELIPWDVINSIDYVMGICKNHGLKQVTIEAILEQQRYYINRFLKFNPEKIKYIAYHEIGHCIVGYECRAKFNGVQIIPTPDSLGTNYFEFEEMGIRNVTNYIDYICIMMAGVMSTERKGLERTDGSYEDIEKASIYARNMILNYSMVDEDLFSYVESDHIQMAYLSESMKSEFDKKYRNLMNDAKQRTLSILDKNEEKIEILVQAVLKKGFLTTKEVDALINKQMTLDEIPDIHDLIFKQKC